MRTNRSLLSSTPFELFNSNTKPEENELILPHTDTNKWMKGYESWKRTWRDSDQSTVHHPRKAKMKEILPDLRGEDPRTQIGRRTSDNYLYGGRRDSSSIKAILDSLIHDFDIKNNHMKLSLIGIKTDLSKVCKRNNISMTSVFERDDRFFLYGQGGNITVSSTVNASRNRFYNAKD